MGSVYVSHVLHIICNIIKSTHILTLTSSVWHQPVPFPIILSPRPCDVGQKLLVWNTTANDGERLSNQWLISLYMCSIVTVAVTIHRNFYQAEGPWQQVPHSPLGNQYGPQIFTILLHKLLFFFLSLKNLCNNIVYACSTDWHLVNTFEWIISYCFYYTTYNNNLPNFLFHYVPWTTLEMRPQESHHTVCS